MHDSYPMWSIILRPWSDVPVFHKLAMSSRDGDMTACGRRVSPYMPMFPTKHAVKFGRPCKGCFPEVERVAREDRDAEIRLRGPRRIEQLERAALDTEPT